MAEGEDEASPPFLMIAPGLDEAFGMAEFDAADAKNGAEIGAAEGA
jgi:hypothetical protein